MQFESLTDIVASGFGGGISISALQESCSAIPKERGVYLVVRDVSTPPSFLQASTGPHLGGRDPSVSAEILKRCWVPNSKVLYVGKAGGTGQTTTLHGRLRSYMEYGLGMQRSHKGGRYIWQLADVRDLRVYWAVHPNEEPAHVESCLLKEFKRIYNCLPFANLRG
jgi:hypothetical protein